MSLVECMKRGLGGGNPPDKRKMPRRHPVWGAFPEQDGGAVLVQQPRPVSRRLAALARTLGQALIGDALTDILADPGVVFGDRADDFAVLVEQHRFLGRSRRNEANVDRPRKEVVGRPVRSVDDGTDPTAGNDVAESRAAQAALHVDELGLVAARSKSTRRSWPRFMLKVHSVVQVWPIEIATTAPSGSDMKPTSWCVPLSTVAQPPDEAAIKTSRDVLRTRFIYPPKIAHAKVHGVERRPYR